MKPNPLLLPLILSLALVACGKDEPAESAAPAAPTAPAQVVVLGDLEAGAADGVGVDAYGLYKASCLSCHGALGEGVGDSPKLAGLTRPDVASRLKGYREGKQMGPKTAVMAVAAKALTDAEIIALANYVGE